MGKTMMPVVVHGQHLHRDVAGGWVLLQVIAHGPSKHIGKRYIERNRRRKILTCERKCFRATKSDKYLEPLFSRKIAKNPRVVDIILNDKEHSVSRLNVLPVILKDFTGIFYGGDGRYGKFQPRPVGSKRTGTDGLSRWPHVRLRQIQSKCTSFAGRA